MENLFSLAFLLAILIRFSQHNPLIVIRNSGNCDGKSGGNGTGACTKTAIIKGQTSYGLPSVCYQRVDPGPCGRDLIRIYYEPKTARCKHFSYSGCGGNANRFVSIKNCYHICHPGLRTRVIHTNKDITEEKTTTVCPEVVKKPIKLNVTSIEQIQLIV